MFFFEKKNQKTFGRFARCWPVAGQHGAKRSKSFFASFFSKKEVLAFFGSVPCPAT